ncbi:acyltransferase [Bacillus sp. 1P10SD]|uniref:acyltransferase n=1 Tax=Bacillus sp. 1P10SD TaxID=3132265 RepID=UPI0039A47E73
MVNRFVKSLMIKLGKITPEDLTVKACIDRGMKVGKNCHGLTASTIDYAHCWLIQIGDNVTFAPQVYLLAHDASTKRYLDYTKIAKIIIEDNVFVGARALIMPGVIIGKNAVIAAGSVVTKSVPEGCIVAGNPARIIGKTNDYIEKHKKELEASHVYDWRWTIGGGITNEMCNQMFKDLNNSFGYVK